MSKRLLIRIFFTMLIITGSCVKETYDMNKLSKRAHISPLIGISAVKGDISLSDLLTPDDTLVFDENNLVKFVLTVDSAIDLRLADFYDFDEILSYNGTYTVGDVTISSIRGDLAYSLAEISTHFSVSLNEQFMGLDGTTNPFPSFPLTNLGETTFPLFTNFEYATLSGGYIDVSVTNNLPAPLNDIHIRLFNTDGHVPIGGEVIISNLGPGRTGVAAIDLSDITVINSIVASVTLTGSPGTSDPVLIDLSESSIEVTVTGRDLRVRSGRVVVPEQVLSSEEKRDTLTVDPGTDTELVRFKVLSGDLKYRVSTQTPLRSIVSLTLSEMIRSGSPLTRSIFISASSTTTGTINVNDFETDLSADPDHPYNRLPFEHTLNVTSYGYMVNFNATDRYNIEVELINPTFDFIEGYFGQETHEGDTDTLDTGLNDMLKGFTGDIYLSDPSINLVYSNSFGIPVSVSINAEGRKNTEIVPLGLEPFEIDHPSDEKNRDITSSFTIDKTNSSLPQLLSLPPDEIRFKGSAKLNPDGNRGTRNNFVFENSRVIGSLELEIPMEIRINNLQFADTVKNFLRQDNDPLIKPEDFEFLRVDFNARNGFPIELSVAMHLYDSAGDNILKTITANDILEAAPVDASGKVISPAESTTTIEFTKDFFSSVNDADMIIFTFTANTTGDGTKDVKIFADYRIDFNAVLILKPDIKFDL